MEKGTVRHVAIIMDGNGRWADRRGLPKVEGHRQGARQVSEVLEAAQEAGVEFLTLYAFSTEMAAIKATAGNTAGTLNLALNYGGRAEIVDAVNRILSEKPTGKIDENSFRNYLYAPDIPDPELMIRTSGELRLSNFLLWQLSYAELYVTDTLWPDFGKAEFRKALDAFASRDRRFGGRK